MQVFIENEAGSRRKNRYDERTLAHLGSSEVSATYPFPYGFIIGTRSGDGDAVDCFVLTDRPLQSGSMVECEPVGLLEQVEDGEVDHKVLAILPGGNGSIETATLDAIRTFVTNVFAHVPGKTMQIGRLLDRRAAETYLLECRDVG
jgi:inorganic pyrophosphatase